MYLIEDDLNGYLKWIPCNEEKPRFRWITHKKGENFKGKNFIELAITTYKRFRYFSFFQYENCVYKRYLFKKRYTFY